MGSPLERIVIWRHDMQWEPIETAPTNGDDFLAYSDVSKVYGLAYWNAPFNSGMTLVCSDSTGDRFSPTHWMPLPPPPPPPDNT